MKRRKKNPGNFSGTKTKAYVIYAQSFGKRMHYDGEKFSERARVKHYASAAQAHAAALALLRSYPILRKYRVWIAPVTITARKGNPSRREEIAQAETLFEDFTGHVPGEVLKIRERPVTTALAIGELDFVGYTTVRDGQTEKYIHKFRKSSRPLLAASADGKRLRIVGGQFQFTEAGIEDR